MKKAMVAIMVCATLAVVLVLGIALGMQSKHAQPISDSAEPVETPTEITVSGSGVVRIAPDKATVSFGVITREKTVDRAMKTNSESVKNVIDLLLEHGIAEKSIRTDYYSMYPQYDWSDSGEQRIVGYNVNTTMIVQDQDIDSLGALLNVCVDAGIDNIDNVSFLCSAYDDAYRQAMTQAVEEARQKAEDLAKAVGKELGDPITITEGWQDTSARYGMKSSAALAMNGVAAADAAGPYFQPGETEISAVVTITYLVQ